MALTPDQATRVAKDLYRYHQTERSRLDRIRRYWKGRQSLPAVIPVSAPREVRELARISRVNICDIVVSSFTQALFVDGFRTEIVRDGETFDENADVWKAWQANRMDRGQSAVHRAALAYGTAYVVVTPGKPLPVITPRSPRKLCAMYGEDPDWPEYALETPRSRNGPWRLYDNGLVHELWLSDGRSGGEEFSRRPDSSSPHGLEVCPVVQYRDVVDDDLDDEPPADHRYGATTYDSDGIVAGQVAPLIPLQDQIDIATFDLKVAEHFAAFKQRYIIGWVADDEKKRVQAAAARIWTFEDHPDNMKIGELEESDLKGYIDSREASIRHAATLSQTPVHELIGQLINLSADALAAADAGRERKADESSTSFGESHEQAMWAVGQMSRPKISVPDDSQVMWRDTSARSFAATVDGLGKLAAMLHVPVEMLWERIPNWTQQDVRRAKALMREGDAMSSLQAFLSEQAAPSQNGSGAFQPENTTDAGLILPAGVTG